MCTHRALEIKHLRLYRHYDNVLTSYSGQERLKIGIVLQSSVEKWRPFSAAKAMATRFEFKATIHIDSKMDANHLIVNVSSSCTHFLGRQFFANVTNKPPHYLTR